MKIFVTRHGESVDDLNGSYGGASNWPLTEHGRTQALAAGKRLANQKVKAIYTSPMRRAHESASLIRKVVGDVPFQTVFDLRERNTYGVMSGLTKEVADELFGYLVDATGKIPGVDNKCAPGGEEYLDFVVRVRTALDYVILDAEEKGYDRIVIVTHGKFTLALFRDVLHVGTDYDKNLASINCIEFVPPKLLSIGD